ncbi:MAG: GNAT family N-acetyltransferase [Planctomycetota bacterium]|jgi:CelD/BcsL family acetyltransferase involved in cellulose biosynthesis
MSNEQQYPLKVEYSDQSPVVHDDLQVTCYRSFDEIQFLREEWDKLVESVGGDLFSSFDWCAVWWKHFGHDRRLELYVASGCGEVVAVLPLFRETIRWGPLALRVIRIVGCDHLTTTCNVAIHPKWIEPVAKTLMLELDRNGVWDMVHLGELPGYSRYAKALAEALGRCQRAGKVIFGDNDYPHMVFDLPPTFDEFLAFLSLKERRNVRRDERRCCRRGSVDYCEPANPRELERAFNVLIKLHGDNWAMRGRGGHFRDWPGVEAFHWELGKYLLRSNRLMFVEVRVNGEPVAVEYGGRFGRLVTWIIGGRHQDITSRIGFCALVRSALATGATQIDALPGYYDYKRRLGARVMGVKTIAVFPPRWTSRLYVQLFKAVSWLIALVYHRIWFWHIAPWLRTKLPNFRFQLLNASLWQRFIRARFVIATKQREPE